MTSGRFFLKKFFSCVSLRSAAPRTHHCQLTRKPTRGAARSGRPQGNTRKKVSQKNDLRSTGLSGKKSRTQGELPCRVLNGCTTAAAFRSGLRHPSVRASPSERKVAHKRCGRSANAKLPGKISLDDQDGVESERTLSEVMHGEELSPVVRNLSEHLKCKNGKIGKTRLAELSNQVCAST